MKRVLHRLAPSILLLAGCLIGVGCRSGTAWSDLWPWGSSPRESKTSPSSTWPLASVSSNAPAGASALRVVDLSFDVIRAELPLTEHRDSLKIWNHVDELRVEGGRGGRLVRNGLRVGAASSNAWPAIQTVLEAAGARFRREELFPQRGLALVIALETIASPEPIFSYTRQGVLAGKTFPAGEKVLNVDYAYHPRLGGVTEIQLSFEIRLDRGAMTWERQGGILRQVPDHDRHVFDDLTVTVTLNPGEYLVIGPHADAGNAVLVGHRFMTGQRTGVRYETLLFITPHAYQTRQAEREPL